MPTIVLANAVLVSSSFATPKSPILTEKYLCDESLVRKTFAPVHSRHKSKRSSGKQKEAYSSNLCAKLFWNANNEAQAISVYMDTHMITSQEVRIISHTCRLMFQITCSLKHVTPLDLAFLINFWRSPLLQNSIMILK